MAASNDPHLIDPTTITYGDIIGEGGFGVVYKVTFKSPNGIISAAAKIINTTAANELQFLSQLKHIHVIKHYGYFKDFVSTTLITELAENGDLESRLRVSSTPLQDNLIWRWVEEAGIGLEHLHDNDYVHGDVKSANFLLMKDDTLKIADFGLRVMRVGKACTFSKGTGRWMAPEVTLDGIYSKKSDIYAYGVVVWEICTRRRPFDSLGDHASAFQVKSAVCNGERPEIPEDVPTLLREIIRGCWHAEYRPTMKAVVDLILGCKGKPQAELDMESLSKCLEQSTFDGDQEEFQ